MAATAPVESGDEAAFNINVIGCVWEGTLPVTPSTIVYHLKLPQQLLFLVRDGETVPLDNDFCHMKHYGVEGDNIWLYSPFRYAKLLMPSLGLSSAVKITERSSIGEIKHFIMQTWGVPVASLSLCCAGFVMADEDTLEDYQFGDNLEIYALVRKEGAAAGETMSLIASVPGRGEFEIEVEECYTIRDVKAVIESASNLPIVSQDLYLGDYKLRRWGTVRSCGLRPFTHLTVVCRAGSPLTLYVDNGEETRKNGKMITVITNVRDSVLNIMKAMPEDENERPGEEVGLFLGDTKLEPHKFLAHYNLVTTSRVSREPLIRLTVTLPGGGVRTVEVKPAYTVGQVKRKIERLCDVPCWMQKLSHMDEEEEEIADDLKLYECEMENAGFWGLRWNKKWSFFCPTYGSSSKAGSVDSICETKQKQEKIGTEAGKPHSWMMSVG